MKSHLFQSSLNNHLKVEHNRLFRRHNLVDNFFYIYDCKISTFAGLYNMTLEVLFPKIYLFEWKGWKLRVSAGRIFLLLLVKDRQYLANGNELELFSCLLFSNVIMNIIADCFLRRFPWIFHKRRLSTLGKSRFCMIT